MRVHTVILSDVHIGTEACQAKLLLKALRRLWKLYRFKQLIINGDLTEGDLLSRSDVMIKHSQFELIGYFGKLKRRGVEIIRVRGNHDGKKDFVDHVLGIKKRLSRYVWQEGGKRFCAIHGHQFDKSIKNRFLAWMFRCLQWLDGHGCKMTRWIDKWHGWACSLPERVSAGAKAYGFKEGMDIVVSAHSHKADRETFFRRGKMMEHINGGDWVSHDHECSLVVTDGLGNAEICYFKRSEDEPDILPFAMV